MKERLTVKEKIKWRKKGYHIGICWKCGKEFVYIHRTYLPAKKEYRAVCPICRKRMEL